MAKWNRLIKNSLKNLEYIDKGKFHKIKIISEFDFASELKKIDSLNKKNHDDLSDHDDISKYEYQEALDVFPNMLLLNSHLQSDKSDKTNKSEKIISEEIIKDKPKTEDDIWDMMDNIQIDDQSESIDNLTTDTKIDDDSNPEHVVNNTTKTLSITTNDGSGKYKICNGCNHKNTLIEDPNSGLLVCSYCGMANEVLLDHGPEWRQYNNDDNAGEGGVNRCGCPSNFFFPKSSQGTIMVGAGNSRLKRKQKWNSTVYKERSLNKVFEKINNKCSKNHIPKIIIDTAKILYKKLNDCKHKSGENKNKPIIIRGINRKSIIAACVFKACEMNKTPKNIKEIAKIFKLDEKKITRGNKQFEKIIKNADDAFLFDDLTINTPEDYIRFNASKLKLDKSEIEMSVRISQNCCKMKLASDHNPQCVAAGSIVAMAEYNGMEIDKHQLSILFGTSDVTIGKIYNKLSPYLRALVDNEATDYIIKKCKING